ncbi:hypothetical protein [Bradyrhizobium sp. BR 10289]|uniref:hypothetical protein n=1 Tax=Bradyrhizobium sp. BR 10289 TaxID=2749993 RepID=UPI001C645DE8|nr:hypothetical protein [Bradyrhizobium sp. BR 10289]MBW7972668.1 hypothetical protein [Bradyrhizobium sp. BR 10289]
MARKPAVFAHDQQPRQMISLRSISTSSRRSSASTDDACTGSDMSLGRGCRCPIGACRNKSAYLFGAEPAIGTIAVWGPALSSALMVESGQNNNAAATMDEAGLIGIVNLLSR